MVKCGEYTVTVDFDDDGGFFHGDVSGVRDGFTFQGHTAAELKEEFEVSLAVYLEYCADYGREPEPSFTGDARRTLAADVYRVIAAAVDSEDGSDKDGPSETVAGRATAQTA